MIRAQIGEISYWNDRATFDANCIIEDLETIKQPSANPGYRPQYTFDLAERHLRLTLRRYSRGDPIHDLGQHFPGLLDAWELSNRLSDEICAKEGMAKCRDWIFELSNLNHYIWCSWLVGLALCLEIPDDQWQRLLALIDGEGEDILLDRVIASRQPGRVIGKKLLHVKPYARLLKTIDAPKSEQAPLLKDFVEYWYKELNRRGDQQPYWYIYGDPDKHSMEMGSYFGRWCIEAVAAVKVFDLDDSLCLGHQHYPGDLLHPDGPSTHPARPETKTGYFGKLFRKK